MRRLRLLRAPRGSPARPHGPGRGEARVDDHLLVPDVRQQRPRAGPLVGAWQLGVARQHGSGVGASGSIVGTNDPLLSRYRDTFLRAQVVKVPLLLNESVPVVLMAPLSVMNTRDFAKSHSARQ